MNQKKKIWDQNYLDNVTIIKEKFLDLINNLRFFQETGEGRFNSRYNRGGLLCRSNKSRIYCSDFRYESNGIFVLGVGFFSSDKFRLFN